MPSTAKGYRYPATTEPVAQLSTATQNLANDLQSKQGTGACGKTDVVASNVTNAFKTVTFPAGRFTGTPNVTVVTSNGNWFGSVGAPSATQFNCYIRQFQNTAQSATVTCNWIARQG